MAIAFGAAGSRFLTASSSSWAVAYPSGISADDLLVLHIVTNGGTVTTPSGWTAVYNETTLSNPKGGLFIKRATGSESGTLTVTVGLTGGNAMMFRYSGVDATTPQDVTATSSTDAVGTASTTIIPAATTVTAGAWLIYANGLNSGSTQVSGVTGSPTPSGFTERVDHGFTGGTGTKGGALYDEPFATAGTVDRTMTLSAPRADWGVMLVLRPDAGGPTPGIGTLTQRVVGIPADPSTEGRVSVKVEDTTSARLICATDSGMTTGIVYGSAETPDGNGYATLTVTGLTSDTRYYYRVEMTDASTNISTDSAATIGRLKTAPVGQADFAFDFGSCSNSTDPIVFPLIEARNDDLFFHLGDMFYNDGSGTSLANIRSKLQGKIQQTNWASLLAQVNMGHTAGDHDVATNGTTNATDATAWANYRTASAELFPDPDLYYTFVWGRVRFIVLDTRNFKGDPAATDNSSKTALGTTQKQWLKDTVDAATEPLIFIMQSDPWIGSAVTSDDTWFGFDTERQELGTHFAASGRNIIICGGDMHAVAAHDGISGSAGGIANFQAAPFGQTASQKGGPWTVGPVPSSGTAFTTHYGRVVITDTGTDIEAAFTAYNSSDVSQVTLTKSYSLGAVTLEPSGIASAEAFGTAEAVGDVTATPTGIASGETFGTPIQQSFVFTDFDDGTEQGWTQGVAGAGSLSVTTSAAHDGTHGAASNVPAASVDRAGYFRTILGTQQGIIRGWWKVTTEGGSGSNVPFARMFNGSTRIADVYRQNLTGVVWLRVVKAGGGSNYWFTSTGYTLPLDTWAYVSFTWGLDGNPEVYINGVQYLNASDQPTDWLAAGEIDTAWLGSQEPGNAGAWNIDTVEVISTGPASTGEFRPLPQLTGEAFGTPNTGGTVTAAPGGVASAEAFGTPGQSGTITLSASGIASGEAFGSQTADLTLSSAPGGIVSAESFGTPTATVLSNDLQPTGIGSAEAFGTPEHTGSLTVTTSAIASGEASGSPAATVDSLLTAAGVGTGEAFGTPEAFNIGVYYADGIGSAGAFGTTSATVIQQQDPTGIGTAEAFGSPVMGGNLPVTAGDVGSLEAVGTPAATVDAHLTASGIVTAAALGTPAATVDSLLSAVAIGTAEAFGSPLHSGQQTWSPTGIDSGEEIGSAIATALDGSITAQAVGIGTGAAFGTPAHTGSHTLTASGINSAETLGTVRAEPHLTSAPASIVDADAYGTPSWVGLWVMQPTGIGSAESVSNATNGATISLQPAGITSSEAFGTPVEQGLLLAVPVTIATAEAFGTAIETGALTAITVGVTSAGAMGFPVLTVRLTATAVGIVDPDGYGTPTATVREFTGRDLLLGVEAGDKRWHVRANYDGRFTLEPAESRFDTEGGL